MSHLALILVVAAITFASRISFLARPGGKVRDNRFLDVFPVTLFVSLAANEFLAPNANLAVTPFLAAAGGAVVGAMVWRRSILGVVGVGLVFYWAVRLLF